jgi:gas vesicle protein
MNKVISFFKSIRLVQILTVFLAGILVIFTTACNGSAEAKVPNKDAGPNPVGQTQPYQGGMNNFSDTAPGQAAKGTAEKTKALVDRAEKDINTKRVDSVDQYVDNYRSGAPIQERTKNIIDSVKGAADDATGDAKGAVDKAAKSSDRVSKDIGGKAQQRAYNIKENTKQAGRDAGSDAEDAADAIKGKSNDVAKGVKRAVDDAATSVKRAAQGATD